MQKIQHLFKVWQSFASGDIQRTQLQEWTKPVQIAVIELLRKGAELTGPTQSAMGKTRGTCRKILKVETALWTFLTAPVEPTNNRAERALRKVVVSRKVQYGSQSDRGSRFVERMQSVIESCRK